MDDNLDKLILAAFLEVMNKLDTPETDTDDKVQGDTVKFISPHFAIYTHNVKNEHRLFSNNINEESISKMEEFANQDFIVVSEDVHFEFLCGHCDNIHVADIIIASAVNKKEYYTMKNCLKLTNKKEDE